MNNFINLANQLGKARQPFFFLIDFEQEKPLIMSVEEATASGLFFEFDCKKNAEFPQPTAPFHFEMRPMPFVRYEQGFSLVQQAIQLGNSYLLNLSYPTQIEMNYSLADIFAATSAKYKLYLRDQFVCFSPETFVRTQVNKIYAYPMKGTINAEQPNALTTLMESDKEQTEHNTIVDLIRNDLALVSKHIQVTKYRYAELVQTHRGAIYQTSSEICGELAENWQAEIGTMLAKLLPAGSISGAPKVKTVEVIQQAEQGKRGYYTGVFGYFDGENLDSAVAIRYIEQINGQFWFRSGGGITAKSQLKEEYQELLEKVYVPISAV